MTPEEKSAKLLALAKEMGCVGAITCVTDAIHSVCWFEKDCKGDIWCETCPLHREEVKKDNTKQHIGGIHEIADEDFKSTHDYPAKHPFGIWYRGQTIITGKSDKLFPKVFSGPLSPPKHPYTLYTETNEIYHEAGLYNSMRLLNPQHSTLHLSTFDWLSLLEHYELPTRLLDWTESILYALYFCVGEMKYDIYDSELCVLNARRLNEHCRILAIADGHNMCGSDSLEVILFSEFARHNRKKDIIASLMISGVWGALDAYPEKFIKEWLQSKNEKDLIDQLPENQKTNANFIWSNLQYKMACAVAVFPNRTNERIRQQLGMFTIHGGVIYPEKELNKELPSPLNFYKLNDDADNKFLLKFLIPMDSKKVIRKQLKHLGIHEHSVFPEMDHQANYMEEMWQFPEIVIF